jgi:ribosome production factor 1
VNSRYAFRSEEKVALQEIGPRFTLKLRSLRKGLPAVQNFGEAPKTTEIQVDGDEEVKDEAQARKGVDEVEGGEGTDKAGETGDDDEMQEREDDDDETGSKKVKPPTQDEFLWVWKVLYFYSFCGWRSLILGSI